MRIGDACPKGLPSVTSIATNSTTPVRFVIVSPSATITAGTADGLVGSHA
jgi:hypothetical protein